MTTDTFDIFEIKNYKAAIKSCVKYIAQERPAINLRYLAEKIPLQYTYLSKCLNNEDPHLSEDHLFAISKVLDMNTNEIEYLVLLRNIETSQNIERQKFLQQKLERMEQNHALQVAAKKLGPMQEWSPEFSHMLDAFSVMVHVALDILHFKQNPFKLAHALGLSESRFAEILKRLESLNLIEWSKDRTEIKNVRRCQVHFGTEHPLSRAHQSQLRSQSDAQFEKLADDERFRFMVTFTANPEVFEKLKQEIKNFLRETEKSVQNVNETNMYQMNLELFRWL